MTKNNKGNLFVFEVGQSVKFVSAIKDAIFNKKNGGKFFVWKSWKSWTINYLQSSSECILSMKAGTFYFATSNV